MYSDEITLYLEDFKESLSKILDHQANELLQIRAGRANPKLIEKIVVDYYGVPTPINQMATISVPEARLLLINVWDISALKSVLKAIDAANLGISPSDDGRVIRLSFPQLTEERRKEFVKESAKISENSRISSRNARRDVLDVFKKMKKEAEISEDDLARLEKEIQKQLDEHVARIDRAYAQKEKELMEV